MKFEELNLPYEITTKEVQINKNITIKVSQYLPIEKKGELITFIVDNAMNLKTGCFVPLRVETYFSIGIIKYYTDLTYEDDILNSNIENFYNTLEINGIFDKVMKAIPEEEVSFIRGLVTDSIEIFSNYNNSFAGVLNVMSQDSIELDNQLSDILQKIKDKDGLELLSTIKKDMGNSN